MGRRKEEWKPVNTSKVKERLKEMKLTQVELAAILHCDKDNLNKRINNGWITASQLDEIGYELDRAPEYLSDETEKAFPGVVFNYSFHEYQKYNIGQIKHRVIEDMIFLAGGHEVIGRECFTAEEKEDLFRQLFRITRGFFEEKKRGDENGEH